MAKITTADCRKFLAEHPEVQQHVRGRYDPEEDYGEGSDDYIKELEQICRNGANPKKWKRNTKYKVGSEIDREGGDCGGGGDFGNDFAVKYCLEEFGVDPRGGVIREFWLEGTDHITYALLEKDGKLYIVDDLSD